MMIHKLNLNNYRTFEDIAVEFNPKLTVIVGQNGTGKTTVLEAAAIAAGTLFYSLAGVVSYGIKKSDAHYKCFDMGSVIDVQPQYPVAISAEGSLDGKIDAVDPDARYDLVNILNLNCPNSPLIAERKSALDCLIMELGNVPEDYILNYCISRLYEFQAENTQKTPYAGILIWYLQTMIAALDSR